MKRMHTGEGKIYCTCSGSRISGWRNMWSMQTSKKLMTQHALQVKDVLVFYSLIKRRRSLGFKYGKYPCLQVLTYIYKRNNLQSLVFEPQGIGRESFKFFVPCIISGFFTRHFQFICCQVGSFWDCIFWSISRIISFWFSRWINIVSFSISESSFIFRSASALMSAWCDCRFWPIIIRGIKNNWIILEINSQRTNPG